MFALNTFDLASAATFDTICQKVEFEQKIMSRIEQKSNSIYFHHPRDT